LEAPRIPNTRPSYEKVNIILTPQYVFNPRSRVLPEKLTGLQLVRKYPAFYETRWFITAFTKTRHLSIS
jgi:hypothetical protein